MTFDSRLVMAQHTSLMQTHTNDLETSNKFAFVLYSAVDAR
jgi:hypothetical protein